MTETAPDIIAAHIRARLAKSTLDSPAINISRAGWALILAAFEDQATDKARRAKCGEHLKGGGEGHPRSKAVITPEGRYGSATLAAEAYGIHPSSAQRRAAKGLLGWRFEVSDN